MALRRRFGISGLPAGYSGKTTPEVLRNAIRSGDLVQVESILNESPELIQSKDRRYRATPLHGASSLGHTTIVNYLIEHGAVVDARDRRGCTPLAWAAAWGQMSVAELLLAHKATIDLADYVDRTPLHWAAYCGRVEVVELLCARGADQRAKNHLGSSQLITAAAGGCVPIAERFLTNGADPDERNNNGTTPLIAAATGGHAAMAELLLARGASANGKDNGGFNALYYAAYSGHLDVVKLLFSHGADVNSGSNDGWTALHAAAFADHLAVVDWLAENGAEVNATNSRHQTSLFGAIAPNSGAAIEKPEKMGEDETEKTEAKNEEVSKSHDKTLVVKCLLSRGADVNQSDGEGATPLYGAACTGDLEVAKLLLAGGADVNAKSKEGWTALAVAASRNHVEVLRLLLAAGADAWTGVDGIKAPFNYSVLNGNKDAAELLLAIGPATRMIRGNRCPGCCSGKQALIRVPLFGSDRQKRKILRCIDCEAIWSKRKIEWRGSLYGGFATLLAAFYGVEAFHDRHGFEFLHVALVACWAGIGIREFTKSSKRPHIWVQGSAGSTRVN